MKFIKSLHPLLFLVLFFSGCKTNEPEPESDTKATYNRQGNIGYYTINENREPIFSNRENFNNVEFGTGPLVARWSASVERKSGGYSQLVTFSGLLNPFKKQELIVPEGWGYRTITKVGICTSDIKYRGEGTYGEAKTVAVLSEVYYRVKRQTRSPNKVDPNTGLNYKAQYAEKNYQISRRVDCDAVQRKAVRGEVLTAETIPYR